MKGFDEYVSLGCNCEVGFQMAWRTGKESTGFFDWRIADPTNVLALMRSGFFGLLRPDRIVQGENEAMLADGLTGFQFHTPFPTGVDFRADPRFSSMIANERAKFQHMARKFLNPDGRRCYLMKLRPAQTVEREVLLEVVDHLNRISPDFHLVVVRGPEWDGHDFDISRVSARTLDFIATMHEADKGDTAGWRRIFDEFPLYAASYEPDTKMSAPLAMTVPPPAPVTSRLLPDVRANRG